MNLQIKKKNSFNGLFNSLIQSKKSTNTVKQTQVVVQNVIVPVVESVPKPVPEPVVESVPEPLPEPIVEPLPEPIVESVPEPVN